MSRPYPLKDGDVIQLGVDYQGRPEGNPRKLKKQTSSKPSLSK